MLDVSTLVGPYEIVEPLHAGRTAELYVASRTAEPRKVVLKRLLPQLAGTPASKAAFLDQAKLAATLVHPRIAQTYESRDEGECYVAMEHVDGIDLAALVRELATQKRRIDAHPAVWIVHEVLDALEFAHRTGPVIHGDLEMSHVLFSGRGEVKLVGFGSPSAQSGEPWHDVLAAGLLLAALITDEREIGQIEVALAAVDSALAAIVMKALATRHTAAELRQALALWLYEHHQTSGTLALANLVEELRGPIADRRREKLRVSTRAVTPPKERTPRLRIAAAAILPLGAPPRRTPMPKGSGVIGPLPRPTELALEDQGDPMELAVRLAKFDTCGDLVGDLSDASALAMVFRLVTTRATGAFVVSVSGVTKELYLDEGRPVACVTNVASEQLGNYLRARGVLSSGELSLLLATMERRGGEMPELIVDLGLVSSSELHRHRNELLGSSIVDVCTWKKGRFTWYAGRQAPRSRQPYDGNVLELLATAALRLDEKVVTASDARARVLRVCPSPHIDPARFNIEGLDELLRLMDGTRTVESIAIRHEDRDARLRCFRLLYLLEACQLADQL